MLTELAEFYQARCRHRDTISQNNGRDFMSISLPRFKTSDGIKNVISKDLNRKHKIMKKLEEKEEVALNFSE